MKKTAIFLTFILLCAVVFALGACANDKEAVFVDEIEGLVFDKTFFEYTGKKIDFPKIKYKMKDGSLKDAPFEDFWFVSEKGNSYFANGKLSPVFASPKFFYDAMTVVHKEKSALSFEITIQSPDIPLEEFNIILSSNGVCGQGSSVYFRPEYVPLYTNQRGFRLETTYEHASTDGSKLTLSDAAVPGDEFVVTAYSDFGGFSSSATVRVAPVSEVSSAAEFEQILYKKGGCYKLVDDIDFAADGYPIWTSYIDGFSGTLDGDGHALSNINILAGEETLGESNAIYCGLFIHSSGSIFDLTVENSSLHGTANHDTDGGYAGLLTAVNFGTIADVDVVGGFAAVHRYNFDYGFITAVNGDGASIENCHVISSHIEGNGLMGSIAGLNRDSMMTNCSVSDTSVAIWIVYTASGMGSAVGVNTGYIDGLFVDKIEITLTCAFNVSTQYWMYSGIIGFAVGATYNWYENIEVGQADFFPKNDVHEALSIEDNITETGKSVSHIASALHGRYRSFNGQKGWVGALLDKETWFLTDKAYRENI